MKIVGVTHPIPTEYAEKIYNDGKNVFIGKSYLGKVSEGDKFIIYESHGAKAYTGSAEIKFIDKMKPELILKKYKNKLIVTETEFKEYSKNRKEMTIIEFENFKKFKNPVKPKRFITVAGKYIYEDEFDMITKNMGN
jgi:hypothetical protein